MIYETDPLLLNIPFLSIPHTIKSAVTHILVVYLYTHLELFLTINSQELVKGLTGW